MHEFSNYDMHFCYIVLLSCCLFLLLDQTILHSVLVSVLFISLLSCPSSIIVRHLFCRYQLVLTSPCLLSLSRSLLQLQLHQFLFSGIKTIRTPILCSTLILRHTFSSRDFIGAGELRWSTTVVTVIYMWLIYSWLLTFHVNPWSQGPNQRNLV